MQMRASPLYIGTNYWIQFRRREHLHPDTPIVSLDSLSLDRPTIVQSITLGDVAIALGFPVGTFIILSNGSEAAIDPIADLSSEEPIYRCHFLLPDRYHQTGFLDIKVDNGFPIPL